MTDDRLSTAKAGGNPRYLLEGLQPEDLQGAFRMGEIKRFRNGDYLVRQDHPSDGIYVITGGVVESVFREEHGRELTLARWGYGDSVGAPNVLSDRAHIWSARAIGPVEALRLQPAVLLDLIQLSPNFAVSLISCIAYKAECYAKLAQSLATHSVESRVAEALLAHGITVNDAASGDLVLGRMRQHDLAKMVGATRQAVSLALKKFEAEELIEIRPTSIVVKKLDGLRKLSVA